MKTKTLLLLAAALTLAGPAVAKAPEPKKPVEIDRFLGRWYEIARTPNVNQKNCFAPEMNWTRVGPDRYAVAQVCHKGSRKGAAATNKGAATVADTRTFAKLNLAFFGGVVRQEYWVIDRADDYRWAIVGTPGGNFIWILARKPLLSAPERAEAVGRARQLGYNVKKLEFAGMTVAGAEGGVTL